jgi:hypothetical protein
MADQINQYAQIQYSNGTGTIINIIQAQSTDPMGSSYTWVNISGYSVQPQIGWTTTDNVNFVPNGLRDAYGNLVTYSTNGTTDSYATQEASISVPTGTPQIAALLALSIQENIAQAQVAVQAFIDSRYSIDTRWNLNALYILAQQNNLTNRAAYITQLFTWAQSVVTAAAVYIATVEAMTNAATVAETTPNFAPLIASDPLITPIAAIAIND